MFGENNILVVRWRNPDSIKESKGPRITLLVPVFGRAGGFLMLEKDPPLVGNSPEPGWGNSARRVG